MGPPVLSEAERAAALAAPPPRVPRKVIVGIIAACLALGLGGIVADHFFPGASKAGTTPLPTGATNPPALPAAPPAGVDPSLSASTAAMMQLRGASQKAAPGFSLTNQSGRSVTLASLRSKVVALWFFDGACDDICPVAEREIAAAMASLGGYNRDVVFVAVNTDPFATSAAAVRPALRAMAHVAGTFEYLTGPLTALDAVWKAYGITVEAQSATRFVSHTEALYFVSKRGRLAAEATPFADQVGQHAFVLDGATSARFARGVAGELRFLAAGAPA